MTGKDKVFQQATSEKQMRLKHEQTLEIEIKASSFASLLLAKSSSNERNSCVSKGSYSASVCEYKPETSGASMPNYSDCVVLNAAQNLTNDTQIASICDRLKFTNNDATLASLL